MTPTEYKESIVNIRNNLNQNVRDYIIKIYDIDGNHKIMFTEYDIASPIRMNGNVDLVEKIVGLYIHEDTEEVWFIIDAYNDNNEVVGNVDIQNISTDNLLFIYSSLYEFINDKTNGIITV